MGSPENLEKIKPYIGRTAQKDLLRRFAKTISTEERCYALYFEAQGGLGKTRLLEDCPAIVQDEIPQVRASRIIDMYNFENRNPVEIEQKLVRGLQQDQDDQWDRVPEERVARYFREYDRLYVKYMQNEGQPVAFRLTRLFIDCWNDLAQKHPLIMRFDTIETLFIQKAPREALISAEEGATGAGLVLEWMEMVLPKLRHTLVLFTGRPIADNPLVALLSRLGLLGAEVQPLQSLDVPAEICDYLGQHGEDIPDQEARYIHKITEGRPLLLTCYAEQRRARLPMYGNPRNRLEFEDLLIETILNPLAQTTQAGRTVAYCLYILSYARRGIRRDALRSLFDELGLQKDDQVIDSLDQLAPVKKVRVWRDADAAGRADGQQPTDMLLFLHDEIYQLIDESGKPDALGLRMPTLQYLCAVSRQQVARTLAPASLLKAMSDHVYYELTCDLDSGYRAYTMYIDRLLNDRYDKEALILSDVFWSTLTYRTVRGGREIYPYLDTLAQSATLSYASILRDEQVRRVKLLRARDKLADALRLAERLYRRFVADGALPDDWGAAADTPLPTYPYPYLFIDFGNVWAAVMIQLQPQANARQLERLFARMIALLNSPDALSERLRLRRFFFLSQVYGLRGSLRIQQQCFKEAIEDIEQGRIALRKYRAQALQEHKLHETVPNDWYIVELAQMTNDLAYVYVQIGKLDRALLLSDQVIEQYLDAVSEYHQALFYNTNTLIHIRRGDYPRAQAAIQQARLIAERSGNQRAKGLILWSHATLERAKMNARRESDSGIDEFYAEAARLLQNEPATLWEIHDDHARFARDIAQLYQARGDDGEARRYREQALSSLEQAVQILPETPSMQRADLIETIVSVYITMQAYERAARLLAQVEDMMFVDMPEYGQIVCGKIALQHSLLAWYGEGNAQQALRWMAIGLARTYVFTRERYGQGAFIRLIEQLTSDIPVPELQRFTEAARREHLYVSVDDLMYQQPDVIIWTEAWEESIHFLHRKIMDSIRL